MAVERRDPLGAGLILLAATCFGTLGPLSLAADDAGVSSLALVTWRAGLGAACVLVLMAARRGFGVPAGIPLRDIPVRDRWFMAAAAGANAVLNLSIFVAFLRIDIALALLIFYLYPAFVAVASVTWFGERLDRVRWAALALSLTGVILVIAGAGEVGSLDPLGIGLALVGAVGQTFYVLAARHGFSNVPGTQAAVLTMGGAATIYLGVAAAVGGLGTLAAPMAGPAAFWPVLLAGVVGAGIPTTSYILGIRRLGAARAAILATFEPVVGVALAAWLLGQATAALQLVGGAMIIVAGVLLQLRRRRGATSHDGVGGPA